MADPFLVLKRLRKIISDGHTQGMLPYGVEEIKSAVVRHTALDYIEFIEFDDPDNPILGRYEKFNYGKPYEIHSNYVEISHSKEANFCWTRFIVVKEICQALFDEDGMCVNMPEGVEELIQTLISGELTREMLSSIEPFRSEKLAEILALELLAPVEERRKIIDRREAKTLTASDMQIALEYRIPVHYVPTIFDDSYISTIERFLSRAAPNDDL